MRRVKNSLLAGAKPTAAVKDGAAGKLRGQLPPFPLSTSSWTAGTVPFRGKRPCVMETRLNPGALDVLRFGTFVAVYELVVHEFTFLQGLVARTKNAGVMHEYVLSLVLADEAKAAPVVEPFNLSAGHNYPSMIQRRGARRTKD